MPPDPPVIADYRPPQPQATRGLFVTFLSFLGGWFVGVLITGILADFITMAWRGHHHDGGMYFIAAFAVVLEVPILALLRSMYGATRVGPLFAFLFGVACGPAILALMFGVAVLLPHP